MREQAIEALFDCLWDFRSIAERVPEAPKPLSRSDVNVLYSIYVLEQELGSVKVTDISRKLNLQSPNVIALVKKLQQLELVCKTADANDRRVVHVQLTEAGAVLVDEYVLAYHRMLGEALEEEEEELICLLEGMRKLGKKVEKTKAAFIENLGGEYNE